MKGQIFMAHCPFELGDIVKIIIMGDALSESEYEVVDIITINSLRDKKTTFKLIVKDEFGNDLAERSVDDFKMIRYGSQKK